MSKPKVTFLASNYIEEWSFDNPDKKGIGHSETSQIELSQRLAKRGYDVVSYAPLPEKKAKRFKGVTWDHYSNADYSRDGVWILYRCPKEIDNFKEDRDNQKLVFMAQDTFYPDATVERYKKLDRFLCLCPDHQRQVEAEWPCLVGKIFLTGNGLRVDLVDQILAEGVERNPKKVIYVSSPDRGLKNAAVIINRAREYDPEITLHFYYGFDNLKTLGKGQTDAHRFIAERIIKDIQDVVVGMPGVVDHGRIPQPDLYREMASAAIVLYPTSFKETGAVAPSMECPALGAIPITNPIWALRTNITTGVIIEGNPDHNLLVRARYAQEVLRLTSDPGQHIQREMRKVMMKDARERFDYERRVDELERLFVEVYQGEPEGVAA